MDVTVLIPAKNRLWSLPKAIESCRSSRIAVQIIVIDDGSTDGTLEWLKSQAGITVIQADGWGKPWGVNKASRLATGKYIRFLDSDDWLNAGANELQFEIAEREQVDLVVAGLDVYKDDTFRERLEWPSTDDFIAQQLGEGQGSHYSAFLFRREFVKDIPHRTLFPASDFASHDDRCFILEVALRHPRIASCPIPALCHRHHTKIRLQFRGALGGVGTNIQHLYLYRQIAALLEKQNELSARRKRVLAGVLWPIAHLVAFDHLDDACEVVAWIKRLDPNFIPPGAGTLGYLYRKLGFRETERVLKLRRTCIQSFRRRLR